MYFLIETGDTLPQDKVKIKARARPGFHFSDLKKASGLLINIYPSTAEAVLPDFWQPGKSGFLESVP